MTDPTGPPRGPEPAVRRPRHLLDPDDIAGSHRRSQGTPESFTRVQRWVMSVLVVTTFEHLAGFLALSAVVSDRARLDARIGLNVLAAFVGCLALAAGFALHRKNPLNWWLLLGLLPAAVGTWFTFR